MRKMILAASAATALALPGAASATVTVVASSPYGFSAYPTGFGFGNAITFDAGGAAYTLSGSAGIRNGTSASAAAPAISATEFDTTNYLAAFPTTSTLSGFGSQMAVSLYWGSIDSFNSLSFYNGTTLVGTVTGAMASINPNGDQDAAITNRRVTIFADQLFDRLVFTTGQDAFEVDNIAFSASVPEPATWAMMLVGFGMVGGAARYRRRKTNVAYA